MSLNSETPPENGPAIVRQALGTLLTQPAQHADLIAESHSLEINIAAPHPVYFVGLSDIANGRLLSAAILQGWRYLVLSGETPIAAANITAPNEGEPKFTHISYGPFARNTIEGIGRAEADISEKDYTLRLLDIPSLYVVSLWFHGADDRLMPLAPSNRALEPYRIYTEEEMIQVLVPRAVERLESDEPVEPVG